MRQLGPCAAVKSQHMVAFYLASPAQVQGDINEVKEPPLDTLFYEKGPNGNIVLS